MAFSCRIDAADRLFSNIVNKDPEHGKRAVPPAPWGLCAPTLVVFGGMRELTAAGSGSKGEGKGKRS